MDKKKHMSLIWRCIKSTKLQLVSIRWSVLRKLLDLNGVHKKLFSLVSSPITGISTARQEHPTRKNYPNTFSYIVSELFKGIFVWANLRSAFLAENLARRKF